MTVSDVGKTNSFSENRLFPERCKDRNWDEKQNAVKFLAQCFCAGTPIRQALDATSEKYGTKAWDSVEAQRALFQMTFSFEEELQRTIDNFTFGTARCARFTRLLLDEIDHCNVDVDETLATRAAELCVAHGSRDMNRWVSLQIPGVGTQKNGCGDDVIILRIADALSSIGLQIWEGGIWLAATLANSDANSDDSTRDKNINEISCQDICKSIQDKRVLEIGAGTGVAAVAIKRQGASKAWLTDIDTVVENLAINIRVNAADDVVNVAALDVSDANHARCAADAWEIDTILAADMTYDDELAKAVITTIATILSGTKRMAWLIATKRNPKTFSQLPELFRTSHLAASMVSSGGSSFFPECFVRRDYQAVTAWCLRDLRAVDEAGGS